jgi:hypothetical protein
MKLKKLNSQGSKIFIIAVHTATAEIENIYSCIMHNNGDWVKSIGEKPPKKNNETQNLVLICVSVPV